ncbi:MAG TPA: hypothetical protein VJ793_21135 [Anaerolineae bacterium]|nr:hypothetical protein [Anaerolineae bacterium]
MRNDERELQEEFDTVGLCRTCRHVKVIESARGSTFYLCRLSETDPRFAKYPRLPVIRCAGYVAKQDEESKSIEVP